jgi:CHAT domain-containing protein
LAPGKNPADSADDGFLTLPEIYELDLKACELAILSACETNYGPEQRGEGVWALSRGFLVAGARRIVASNWLVDDEAAASLISYFCGGLAAAEKEGSRVDYAQALHNAQRWVRQQDKWSSPYYWGTFVFMGPN